MYRTKRIVLTLLCLFMYSIVSWANAPEITVEDGDTVYTFTINGNNGVFYCWYDNREQNDSYTKTQYRYRWRSNPFTVKGVKNLPWLNLQCTKNDIGKVNGGINMHSGSSRSSAYTLSVPEGWAISKYTMTCTASEGNNYIVQDDNSYTLLTKGVPYTFVDGTVNNRKCSFLVTGDNKPITTIIKVQVRRIKVALFYQLFKNSSEQEVDSRNVKIEKLDSSTINTSPSLPKELRRGFCSYGYNIDKVVFSENVEKIRSDYKVNTLPFKISDGNNYYYYNLNVGPYKDVVTNGVHTGQVEWLYQKDATKTLWVDNSASKTKDNYCWYFEGNPYCLYVRNKATGDYLIPTSNGPVLKSYPEGIRPEHTWDLWGFFESTAGSDASFALRYDVDGNYKNSKFFAYTYSNVTHGTGTWTPQGDLAFRLVTPKSGDIITTRGLFVDDNLNEYEIMRCRMQVRIVQMEARNITYRAYWSQGRKSVGVQTVTTYYDAKPQIPENLKMPYCNYTYYSDNALTEEWTSDIKISDNGKVIYVLVDWNGPFEVSTNQSALKWNYTTINGKLMTTYGMAPYFLADNQVEKGGLPYDISPNTMWAFTGNPYDGFVIWNKAYERAGMVLGNPYYNDGVHQWGKNQDYYTSNVGPAMLKYDANSNSCRWNIEQYDDNVFGFSAKDVDYMYLNDTYHNGLMGYYYQGADLSAGARMQAHPMMMSGKDMDNSWKQTYLNTMVEDLMAYQTSIGQPNSLTVTAFKEIFGDSKQRSRSEIEAFLANADNARRAENVLLSTDSYEKVNGGHYTFVVGDGFKESTYRMYMGSSANTNIENVKGVNQLRSEKDLESAVGDAGAIFTFTNVNDEADSWALPYNKVIAKAQNCLMTMDENADEQSVETIIYPWARASVAVYQKNEDSGYFKVSGTDASQLGKVSTTSIPSTFYLKKTENLKIKMMAFKTGAYNTLCVPFNVTLPEEITAYTLEENEDKSKLMVTKLGNEVSAGIPVLLKSEDTETTYYNIALDNSTNMQDEQVGRGLRGKYLSYVLPKVNNEEEQGSHNRFYFLARSNSNTPIFARCMSSKDTKINPNRAFYTPTEEQMAKGASFSINWDEVTAVSDVKTSTAQSEDAIYDLQGRKVQNPSHGIYIKNGKKVVIK